METGSRCRSGGRSRGRSGNLLSLPVPLQQHDRDCPERQHREPTHEDGHEHAERYTFGHESWVASRGCDGCAAPQVPRSCQRRSSDLVNFVALNRSDSTGTCGANRRRVRALAPALITDHKVWLIAEHLNTVRNRLAHSLDSGNLDSKIAEMWKVADVGIAIKSELEVKPE